MRALHRVAVALLLLAAGTRADAQLDPLLFLKGSRPNVLVALDLSSRMQRDPRNAYLDPVVFERTGEPFETTLGVGANVNTRYRRRYTALEWARPGGPIRGTAGSIEIVGDREAGFAAFDGLTRLGRARAAIRRLVEANRVSARFGLVTSRQAAARIDTTAWETIGIRTAAGQPTDTGVDGSWRAGVVRVDAPGSAAGAAARLVAADAAGASDEVVRLLEVREGTAPALLAGGLDTDVALDAPIGLLLDDVRAEAARLAAGDRACSNTVAVLVTGGADPSLGQGGLADRALAFADVAGHRLRLYVVAIAPPPSDVAALRLAAERGGGQYIEIGADAIERVPAADVVPEIVQALCTAVQHAFAASRDYDGFSTSGASAGPPSYFATSSPVVGTVNLENAADASGALLPDTRVTTPGGSVIPQSTNVALAGGFDLPGFVGRLSAFRVYRPVADAREAGGYRFSTDGTRIWTARTPAPDARNIFTIVPGVGVVAFRPENADLLAPFLGARSAARVIALIRSLPLGPIVHSTPALLEPPSMPFPDADYADFVHANRRRRAIVFVGADDGMMHAVDARTGVEVWAAIPFNLLPRLRLLESGRAIDDYPFLLEGSPRLADVKVGGAWRSYLFFGEGRGGTFYQAFDVTLDRIADSVPPDVDAMGPLLAFFSSPGSIRFAWSFPSYTHFDAALAPWGDVSASATSLEKSVGESWSTPTVGRVAGAGSPFVALVGSGPLAPQRERQANRAGVRAGTRAYLLDAASGVPLDSASVDSDGEAEDQDGCPAEGCRRLRNALPADAVSPGSDGTLRRAYMGDLDGRLWRLDVAGGSDPPRLAGEPRLLFTTGADQPIFAAVAVVTGVGGLRYLFLATGSDLLPRAAGMPALRLIGLEESSGRVERRFERLLRSGGSGIGGEAATGGASVAGGVAFYVTGTVGGGNACEPATSEVYALTLSGGAAYDANGDGRRDDRDPATIAHLRGGRATAPVTAARHVFLASGDKLDVLGDPDRFNVSPGFLGVRILSWREVR